MISSGGIHSNEDDIALVIYRYACMIGCLPVDYSKGNSYYYDDSQKNSCHLQSLDTIVSDKIVGDYYEQEASQKIERNGDSEKDSVICNCSNTNVPRDEGLITI